MYIGNGDIVGIKSAVAMYENTGCDLIMVGRGAMGNPWIFQQLEAYFLTGKELPPPTPEEKMQVLLKQIALACEYKGEYVALKEARSHTAWYLRGFYDAARLRKKAGQMSTYQDLIALTQDALSVQPKE